MTTAIIISLVMTGVLGLIHFWNEKIVLSGNLRKLGISFVAGTAVAYSFLFLLPDVSARAEHFGAGLYYMLLAGFITVHIFEKFAYRHAQGRHWHSLHSLAHFLILFIYYTVVGSILYGMAQADPAESLLFFVPLAFYAMVGVTSFEEMHEHVRYQPVFRWLFSSAAIIGVLIAVFTSIHEAAVYHALFAFAVGGFFYITMVDLIPARNRGTPLYFALGAMTYATIMMLVL